MVSEPLSRAWNFLFGIGPVVLGEGSGREPPEKLSVLLLGKLFLADRLSIRETHKYRLKTRKRLLEVMQFL